MREARTISICAVLIALALGLSYIERFIPLNMIIPLPGVKLGLANIVTLVALYHFKPRYAFAILVIRCLMGSIFGGGVTALCFSMTGGILSMTVMALTKDIKIFSVYGVSILGAATHMVGQILAAVVLMDTVYIGAYLPYLLIISIATGFVTGTACAQILRVIRNASISK